jgi:hypothetical protein
MGPSAMELADGVSKPRLSAAGMVVTLVMVAVYAGLMWFSVLLSGGMVMGTDPCAYQECGDQKWVGYAVVLALEVGATIFVINLFVVLGV